MVRSYWIGTPLVALALSTGCWGQHPASPPSPATKGGERIITLQEKDHAAQKCRLLKAWKTAEGKQAYQLQVLETGEMLTVVETEEGYHPSGNSKVRAVSTRIFHWGQSKTPPTGCPVPPAEGVASKSVVPAVDKHPTGTPSRATPVSAQTPTLPEPVVIKPLTPSKPLAPVVPPTRPETVKSVTAPTTSTPAKPTASTTASKPSVTAPKTPTVASTTVTGPKTPTVASTPSKETTATKKPAQQPTQPLGKVHGPQFGEKVQPVVKSATPHPAPSTPLVLPLTKDPVPPGGKVWPAAFSGQAPHVIKQVEPKRQTEPTSSIPAPPRSATPATATRPSDAHPGTTPRTMGTVGKVPVEPKTVATKDVGKTPTIPAKEPVKTQPVPTTSKEEVPTPVTVKKPRPVVPSSTEPAQPTDWRQSWGKVESKAVEPVDKDAPPLPVKPVALPYPKERKDGDPLTTPEAYTKKVHDVVPSTKKHPRSTDGRFALDTVQKPTAPTKPADGPVQATYKKETTTLPPAPPGPMLPPAPPVPAPTPVKVEEKKPVLPPPAPAPVVTPAKVEEKKPVPPPPVPTPTITPVKVEEKKPTVPEPVPSAAPVPGPTPLLTPARVEEKKPATPPAPVMPVVTPSTSSSAKPSTTGPITTVSEHVVTPTPVPGGAPVEVSPDVPLGSGSVLAAGEVKYVPVPIVTVPDVKKVPRGPMTPPPVAPQPNQAFMNPARGGMGGERVSNAFTTPAPSQPLPPDMGKTGPGMSNAFSAPDMGVVPQQLPGMPGQQPTPEQMVAMQQQMAAMQQHAAAMQQAQVVPGRPMLVPQPIPGMAQGPYQAPASPMTQGYTPASYQAAGMAAPGMSGVAPAHFQAPAQGPLTVPQTVAMLTQSDYPSQREWAADQLGDLDWRQNPITVQSLQNTARSDPAPLVRAACVRTLARMRANSAPVLATIHSLKNDPDPRVRDAVTEALAVLQAGTPGMDR